MTTMSPSRPTARTALLAVAVAIASVVSIAPLTPQPAQAATTQVRSAADPGDAPVSVTAPISAAAYTGQQPNLPSTVTVDTASGGQRSAAVSWDLHGYSFTEPYRSLTVYGSVEGTLPVTAQVEVIPSTLLYYIDSGTAGLTSAAYRGAASLASGSLLNATSDQASTGGSWGYLTSAGYGGTLAPGSATDKDSNGLYGKNSSAESLTYTLTNVPAGTYTLTAGIREWWSGPRTMKLSVQPAGAASVDVTGSVAVGAGSGYSKTAILTGTFVQPTAGDAVVRMTRTAGSEAPVFGWLALAGGNVDVTTTIPTVAAPTSAVAAGTYKTAQTVDLASTTPDAAIYYTTDGSDATRANGTLYTGPLAVDAPTTVKAIAFRNGVSSGQFQAAYDIQPVPSGGYDAVPVGKTWYDTDGDAIQAHGGGFLQKDGWYWWVGENKSKNNANLYAVSLYKSKDLLNWEFVHDIITLDTPGVCTTGSFSGTDCNIERPKLIYNAATGTYVLWGHWETGNGYAASHLIVATSSTIDGDYRVVRNFRPGAGEVTTPDADPTYTGGDSNWGYGSRDFTIFQDPDTSAAYLVSTQDGSNMRVYKLTDDDTNVDWQNSYQLFAGQRREAPALVKVGSRFYVFTSSQSGWYPNQAMVSSTADISDPDGWSALAPVGNNSTYYSQPTNIMAIDGADGTRQYVYMGDHWNPSALGASTYVWLPLTIDGDTVTMDYHPVWRLNAAGQISYPVREELVSQGKPATGTGQSADHPASAANDGIAYNLNTSGDSSNYYLPPSVPYSWQVDLGAAKDLTRADLSWRSWNGSETYSQYAVSGSTDGTSWTRIASRLADKTVGFTSDTLSGTYRYVRVDVANVVNDHNGSAAAWAAGLVEVQVYAAVPPVAPDSPASGTAALAGADAITVSWTAPADNGGSAVTGYRVYEAGSATPVCEAPAGTLSCTVAGLSAGTTHRYEVAAVNAVGESERTGTQEVTIPTGSQPSGPATPALTLSATSGRVGDTLTVTGSGFPAGATPAFVFHSTPVDLGTATAAADGTLTFRFTIPDVPAGAHTLTATVDGAVVATAAITVEAAASGTTATTGDPADTLASTGSQLSILGILLAALLLAGGGLVLLRRRRAGGPVGE